MSNILNTYPVFESNQVLTSTQLNSLVNYLDQQNRLTRAKLIGMGVVCGLEVSYDQTENEITISKGTGLTSEGYLISLGECVTERYRPYTLPAGTIYEPFVDASNQQDITLYELLTKEADAGPDDENLADETFLSDKIVLLFIESFDKDLKSCLGKSCDELGKERILTIRKLLISIDDLQTVWNRTNTGKLDAMFPEKFDLPTVNLPRTLFDPAGAHATDYTAFSEHYAGNIITVFDALFEALTASYDVYRPLFLESYDEQNPFEVDPVLDKIGTIRNFVENNEPTLNDYLGIQYVYDLFIDLILAYNEFKVTAFDLLSECSPDMSRFPRHLMLGQALGEELSLCESSPYRHYFVQPPVYNLQKLLLQKTIALHNRIVLMLESFDLNRINGQAGEDGDFDIRITPSLEKRTLLSQRAIPWYYDANLPSSYSSLGRLKDYWNFDISRTCPVENDGLVLSYDDQSDDQSVADTKLATPLFYDIQDYSFFRIEGYINKSIDEATQRIRELKGQFNLPFDMVSLQLDPDAATLEIDYSCGFEDLQEEYLSARASLCGIITDMNVLYDFVKENEDILFEGEDDGDEQEILDMIRQLLDRLNRICDAMGRCIQDFDFSGFREAYKEVLQYIIDFFLVEQKLLDEIEINEVDEDEQIPLINGLLQRLFPPAYKFVDLLFYTRFLRLYYAFKRREFYLRKETAVFSGFLTRHPGIDHQAGVRKGGTFIMVYNNAEDNNVIADFNLPYLCCGSENCVPMCDDGSFVFDIAPFARPDYAITTINHAVNVNVLINDYQLLEDEFEVEAQKTSEFGGKITQEDDTALLTYKPRKDFTGTDTFTYSLTSRNSGKKDQATVTILVKNPDEKEGCYSIPILECWGQKEVLDFLAFIKLEPGDNPFETLLNYLQSKQGFSDVEIRFLLEVQALFALLKCINPDLPDDMGNEQMREELLRYQATNCQGGNTAPCYTLEILGCWGRKSVLDFLAFIKLEPGNDPFVTLLNYLRSERGFSRTEISFLLEMQSLFALLRCINPDLPEDMDNEQMRQELLRYQAANCQGGGDRSRITINPRFLSGDDMAKVLELRGIRTSPGESKTKLEKALRSSENSNNLSETELMLLTRESLSGIMDAKKIKHLAQDNKSTLIRKLLG